MADEFMKGFGIATGAGLLWMVLAGWYNTPHFDSRQLLTPAAEDLGTYGDLAITLKEASFWLMVAGPLVFWVVLPALREARESYASE